MSVEKNVPGLRFEGFSDEWVEKPLNHEVELFSGLTYSPKDIRKQGVFVIRSSNVKNGQIVQADNVYVNPEVVNCSNVKKGDIIVVVRNGSRALIGKHAQVNSLMDNTVIGAFMTGVRASYPEFINALFDTDKFKAQVEKNLGATINQITNGAFNSMVFMFPEGQEKTAIGNTFQKLDNLINQHQQKHDKLSNIKKAMLEKMFPKQGETIPEIRFKGFSGEWVHFTVGYCSSLITKGTTPMTIGRSFVDSGISFVKVESVDEIGNISQSKFAYIDAETDLILARSRIKENDLLISIAGALGRAAIVKKEILPANTNQALAIVRLKNDSPVKVEFLYHFTKTKDFKDFVDASASQGAQPNLSLGDISNIRILAPKKEEQAKIGNYFQKLDTLINQHQQQIIKLNNIKQACLSKMFV